MTLTGPCKLQGIGSDEPFCVEGVLRHDHVDLCILVSGKMTVWCDGLPVHGIYPGEFINSVEWISVLRLEEELQDFGWEQQVEIKPDEDSVYLRVRSRNLLYCDFPGNFSVCFCYHNPPD